MSKIEVNEIVKSSGSTLTLGGCGTAVTLGSGATQTGFGRTGTVDWQTGSIKTSTFTATSGEGYFVNTTGGAVTVNLPAGVAGAIVGLKDYAGTWDSNAVTLNPNGSDKIAGGTSLDPTLTSEGGSILLVFVDSTQGWLTTQQSVTASPTGLEQFINATGGNAIVTCGNFKTHIFTSPGTFGVTSLSTTASNDKVDYLVVAGGGGGGQGANPAYMAGAGGAGGFRMSNDLCMPAPTTSPLANSTGLTATVANFPITVGAGGAKAGGDNTKGTAGSVTTFSTITSAGGGQGGAGTGPDSTGGSGGSGGGGTSGGGGGSGNSPPVSPSQGNDGSTGPPGSNNTGGGGGGAGAAAGTSPSPNIGASGGVGSFISDTMIGPTAPSYGTPGPVSSTRYFAGGGSGSSNSPSNPPSGHTAGGAGGGGKGGKGNPTANADGGTANTGGGGGGGSGCGPGTGLGGDGGSGIVIIRYKFQ